MFPVATKRKCLKVKRMDYAFTVTSQKTENGMPNLYANLSLKKSIYIIV